MNNSGSSTMSLTKSFIPTPNAPSPYNNGSSTGQANEGKSDYNYGSPMFSSNSTGSSPVFGKASISTVGGSPASTAPPTTSVSQENVFSTTDGASRISGNSTSAGDITNANDERVNTNSITGSMNGDPARSDSHPSISVTSPNHDQRQDVTISNNSGLGSKEINAGGIGDSLAVTSPQNIAMIRKNSIAHSQGIGGVSWGSLTIGSWLRDEVMFNSMLKQQNYNGANNGSGKDSSTSTNNGPNLGTGTISYRRLSTINNYNNHGGRNSTSTAGGKTGFPASPPGYTQSAYMSNLEQQYCKDYSCCGLSLPSLHDLLRHYEEVHININTNHPMGLDHMLTPVTDDGSSTANSTADNGYNYNGSGNNNNSNNNNNNNSINVNHQGNGNDANGSTTLSPGTKGNAGLHSDVKTPLISLNSRYGSSSAMEDFRFRNVGNSHSDNIMVRDGGLAGGGDAAIDPISKYTGHEHGIGGISGVDASNADRIHGAGADGQDTSSAPSLLLNNALMGSTNMFMMQDNDGRLGGDPTFQFRHGSIGGNGLMDSIPNYTTANKSDADGRDVDMGINDLVIDHTGVNGTDRMELDFMDDDILGNVGGMGTIGGIDKNPLSRGDQPSHLTLEPHTQQFQQPPSMLSSPSSMSQAAQNSPGIALGHQDVSVIGNVTPIIHGAPYNDHGHDEGSATGANSTALSTPLMVNSATDKFELNLGQNLMHFGYGTTATTAATTTTTNTTSSATVATASNPMLGDTNSAAGGLNFQLHGIGVIGNMNGSNTDNSGGITAHPGATGINNINMGGNNILVNPSASLLQAGNKSGETNTTNNILMKSNTGAGRYKGRQSHINKMAQDGYIDDPARKLYVIDREEHRPFKCPVIGCEKTYKNQNGLKYHKLHGHQNQKLHENPDGTFSIIDPYSNEPYPDGMAYEKDKPYRCEVCGKRYKNLNGLKYHRGHTTH